MRHSLTIAIACACACLLARGQSTNLVARVQADFTARNAGVANGLVNSLKTAVNPHSPRAGRSIEANAFADPDGVTRVHMLYEFDSFAQATNFFSVARLQQNPNISGRLVIYCQPEEFTALTDWAGADRDPRAKRTELQW